MFEEAVISSKNLVSLLEKPETGLATWWIALDRVYARIDEEIQSATDSAAKDAVKFVKDLN